MEKSASFPAYSLGTTLSAQAQGCYLGIEPLLQRAASTGDAELLLTLLKVCQFFVTLNVFWFFLKLRRKLFLDIFSGYYIGAGLDK